MHSGHTSMSDLISALIDGVRGSSVPRPVPNEPIDDFRFRCAHAGAMLALSWIAQNNDSDADTTPSDTTVTPLPVTPPIDVSDPDDFQPDPADIPEPPAPLPADEPEAISA